MSETVFLKNPSGRIVDVPEEVAEELLQREGYSKASKSKVKEAEGTIYGIDANPRYSDADRALDENPPEPLITEVREKPEAQETEEETEENQEESQAEESSESPSEEGAEEGVN